MPTKGVASSSGPFFICLYHSPEWCPGIRDEFGNNINLFLESHVHEPGLVIDWQTLNAGGDSKELQNEFTLTDGRDPGQGDCFQATGLGKQLTQASCGSPHGVYWQPQFISGTNDNAWRLWNTEFHCYMTAARASADTFVECNKLSGPAVWSTWAFY